MSNASTPIDLRTIPLFSQLGDDDARALASLLKERTFKRHEPIFWIGDTGTEFHIVRDGQVMLSFPDESGKENLLALLKPGDFFGEISLLDGGPRTATARAQTDCTLLSLDREQFQLFLSDHGGAAIHIISVISRRQRETMARLRGVQNVNQVMEEQATLWQRAADRIVNISGSEIFAGAHVAWFIVWMWWNWRLGKDAFDPAPFDNLALIISFEAIFLSLFVLVSQNRSGDRAKIQADLDYQVNLKAQHEVMRLHEKLDKLMAEPSQER
ncbi:MAG: DUF1003 domain-containing protein [Tepidisphaeraceae bacterium]